MPARIPAPAPGLQADLKTFSALGVYGLTAVTCVVAEVPGKVARIEAVDAANVRAQIELLLGSFPVGAIKTGLLFQPKLSRSSRRCWRIGRRKIPLIVDPVMIATSGDRLLQPAAVESYRARLFPQATLVTPNLDEAEALIGRPVRDLREMKAAGNESGAKIWDAFFAERRPFERQSRDRSSVRWNRRDRIFGAVRAGCFNSWDRMHLLGGNRRSDSPRRCVGGSDRAG